MNIDPPKPMKAILKNDYFDHVIHGNVPFWQVHYFIDRSTGITLTIQENIHRGFASIDFRGLTDNVNLSDTNIPGWECEYFCEPESVFSNFVSGKWQAAYLTYLNGKVDVVLNGDKMLVYSHWSPGMGNLCTHLPKQQDELLCDEPSVNLTEKTVVSAGNRLIKTTLSIGSPSGEDIPFVYVYQDAAFLSFGRGSQATLIPFAGVVLNDGSIDIVANYSNVEQRGYWNKLVFAGNMDIANGVVSLILSEQLNGSVGNIGWYLGFEESENINHFVCVMRNKCEPLNSRSIPESGFTSRSNIDSEELRNIFFAFSHLCTGYQMNEFDFFRLMDHCAGGFQDINAGLDYVKSLIIRHKDDFQLNE
jgi:hypothetical protein